MKESTQEDIQAIVAKIESGLFERTDVKILFIDIREYLDKHSLIREIAHFIAHPQERKQGITFDHLQKFVDDFIDAMKHGGKFKVEVIFPQKEVIDQLIKALQKLGISTNNALFTAQSTSITKFLLEIIDETNIDVKNAHVTNARISGVYVQGQIKSLVFKFNVLGVISVPPNISIAIPVLELVE
jgi:NCAIR mutase (PurE)-related protein